MFMRLTNYLKRKIFRNREEAENTFFNFIAPKKPNFFLTGIEDLITHWQRYLDASGAYFEQNKSVYYDVFIIIITVPYPKSAIIFRTWY